jgi:hypothetical protein
MDVFAYHLSVSWETTVFPCFIPYTYILSHISVHRINLLWSSIKWIMCYISHTHTHTQTHTHKMHPHSNYCYIKDLDYTSCIYSSLLWGKTFLPYAGPCNCWCHSPHKKYPRQIWTLKRVLIKRHALWATGPSPLLLFEAYHSIHQLKWYLQYFLIQILAKTTKKIVKVWWAYRIKGTRK